jgi:hypothetical protein
LLRRVLATLFDFPWDERGKLTCWSDLSTFMDFDAPDALVSSEAKMYEEQKKMTAYFKVL